MLPAPCPRASLGSGGCRAVPGRRAVLGVARGQARRLWAGVESLAAGQQGFGTGRLGFGGPPPSVQDRPAEVQNRPSGVRNRPAGIRGPPLVFQTPLLELGTVYIGFGFWLSGFGTGRCSGTGVAGKLSGKRLAPPPLYPSYHLAVWLLLDGRKPTKLGTHPSCD